MNTTAVQATDGPGSPLYTANIGGGLITAWRVVTAGSTSSPGIMKLKVFRPVGGGSYQTLASVPGTIPTDSTQTLRTFEFPARTPIQAGDRLGLSSDTNVKVRFTSQVGSLAAFTVGADPAPGATFSPGGSLADFRILVEAKVEPDSDHDGYGDETQDSCPFDATRHTGACPADLSAALTSSRTLLTVGKSRKLTVTVKNLSPGAADNVRLVVAIPSGLRLTGVSTASGTCRRGALLVCRHGRVPGGASGKVTLTVKALTPGRQTIRATVSHGSDDPSSSNDDASSTVRVKAKPKHRHH